MNLFNYTKKISEKINFYDEIAKNPFFGFGNPFAKPINITIIWVEDNEE